MLNRISLLGFAGLLVPAMLGVAFGGMELGDVVQVNLRGVPTGEQEKVNGEYRVGESGGMRMPMIDGVVPVRGMTTEQVARAIEKAYQEAGIFAKPAIEVMILKGKDFNGVTKITVGGQVRKPGDVAFEKGMTLLQALQSAGDRNEYGGRNMRLFRKGKVTHLDFRKIEHKNLPLEPGDAIQVEQAGALEFNRG